MADSADFMIMRNHRPILSLCLVGMLLFAACTSDPDSENAGDAETTTEVTEAVESDATTTEAPTTTVVTTTAAPADPVCEAIEEMKAIDDRYGDVLDQPAALVLFSTEGKNIRESLSSILPLDLQGNARDATTLYGALESFASIGTEVTALETFILGLADLTPQLLDGERAIEAYGLAACDVESTPIALGALEL